MNDQFLISRTSIENQQLLGEGENCTTYLSTLSPDNVQCVSKIMKKRGNSQDESNLMNYIQILKKLEHPGIIPFIGFILSNDDERYHEIIYKYSKNLSLQHILDGKLQENASLFTQVRKYIIIYGIAQTMNFLHDNNTYHERLTPSNVLLDENLEPKLSDFNLSKLYPDFENPTTKSLEKKLYYYTDPEILDTDRKITDKSDVYAFAIITIQILSENPNIYQSDDDILHKIKNGLKPIIPQDIPDDFSDLLLSCIDHNSDNRPSFKSICSSLDSIIQSIPEINTEEFQLYKQKIQNFKSFDGNSIDTQISNKENLAENQNYLSNYTEQNDDFFLLANDPFFDQIENDFKEELNNIDDKIKEKEAFNFDTSLIEDQNFILTNKSKENLLKLYKYIEVGVPVLLEGQTGTAKTLTSEIVCKLARYELIHFNLSSETKIQDLFGRYTGDENSWSGISYQDGPFTKAFTSGSVLLLDEINLAPASVLQCIEEALDSGHLSVEIAGKPLKEKIEKNPRFRLIATQNPNKGSYANKRQNLGQKFYSRFQVINFPPFTEDELYSIAEGLSAKFGYNDLNVIADLVSFHKAWSENPAISDDIQCFTIREIAATVKALSKNQSPYDTIMTIYGARYEKETKQKLENLLRQYQNLYRSSDDNYVYPQIDGCYMNNSLKSALKSTLFSLNNGRNVILTGKKGCGKTQVAIWISELYNKMHNIANNNGEKQSFFCFCSEEIRVSDLIGHQAPSGKSDGTTELIKWQDGFLIKAIKMGVCAVLESIDEAPSTVTERMNGLLDQKYDEEKERFFETPENSKNPKVMIKDSFRILATSDIDKIQQMSPAFLNRFDIIVLENQIDEDISEDQFTELITTLMDRYSSNIASNTENIVPNDDESTNILSKFNNMIQMSDDDDDDNEEEEEEGNDNNNNNHINENNDTNNTNNNNDNNNNNNDNDNNNNNNDNDNNNNNNNTNNNNNNNNSSNFKYPQRIIPLIYETVRENRDISYISKICNSIVKISAVLLNNNNNDNNDNNNNEIISDEQIVTFVFNLLQNNKQFDVPKKIEKILRDMFQPIKDTTDDPFFYENSSSLCSFMAKLAAYSIIQQPVCVTGPTGRGKTSAARAFSLLRKQSPCQNYGFRMHSFHSGTKVSHFFGSTTLQDGKIVFHKGTLTEALELGLVFIADEFNLSTQSVMKSLSLALDPTIERDVFIPGIGEITRIHQDFHFIACQNELGTLGRNAIPDSIKSRFIEIDYPMPQIDDIESICISILKNIRGSNTDDNNIEKFARCTANYMLKINDNDLRRNTNLFYVPMWSLRDITKLFRRIFANNNQNMINITPIHHVLFYTMSAVPPKYEEKVLNDVKTIIKQSYNLESNEIKEYIDCYNKEPTVTSLKEGEFYIMKGNSGIRFDNSKQFIDKRLPSLFNAIFKISLSDKMEPILITGNSGFKTFLSQLFLPKTPIITLNQETKVAQLLGTSAFMKDREAKLFYIDNICKILNAQNDSNKLKKEWENKKLSQIDFEKFISTKKKEIPDAFYYALDHLSKKLFQPKDDDDCIILDTTLEFRPGIFLDAILQGQSLILKDISNLPTIVLERFNELFSGKQSITLSEDIHDTFTAPDSKELTNFNNSFRVFTTCSENSISKLSEAALSRFTVISVSEYSQSEQEIAIKSYVHINNLLFNKSDFNALNQFSFTDLSDIKLQITFPRLIKIVEIASKLNQQRPTESIFNIGFTIFRVLGGILGSNKSKRFLLNKIKPYFNNFSIPDHNKEECQLIFEQNDKINGLKSNISQLFLKCPSMQNYNAHVAFTNSFNDLLDVIHMGLVLHNPIILEGPPGQGKHEAINYITKILNKQIEPIVISQSTKVEDLFGKETLVSKEDGIHVEMTEPQFIKIIKSTNIANTGYLILLENLNSGSQALLDALVPVFNTHSDTVFLPNGSIIQKGTYDIIGIFNTQQISSSIEKLPTSLINSSIYNVVPKSEKAEIFSIILTKFSSAKLTNEEAIDFYNNFNKAKEIAIEEGCSSEIFTLNDIDKYILLRTLTKNFFNPKTITQMIFVYRFSSNKIIKKMIKSLNLEKMKFRPIFGYNIQNNSLFIRLSKDDEGIIDDKEIKSNDKKEPNVKDSNGILFPLLPNFEDVSHISEIQSLTLPQKHCLTFLAFSVLQKRSCVIQGDTASGKSKLIRLFAQLTGAKLHIYQMNSECNLSMLAGQSTLNDLLSENDKRLLRKAFNDLSIDARINDYISNFNLGQIDVNNDSTWTPKAIKNLLNYVQNLIPDIEGKYIPEIKGSIRVIKQVMSPVMRFEHNESTFINAIRNGEWVLIDGIESAPSVIAEKISSLCGEDPELNLFEYGSEYLFSKNNKSLPENKIHDGFHLFITYNQNSVKESQMIDQTFLAKSLTFTLPPFDSTIENSSQMLLGSFLQLKYQPSISEELAARFALLHDYAKTQSQSYPDNFAGDIQYNGRTLNNIIKAFELLGRNEDILVPICFSITSFYLNSYIDGKNSIDFQSNCLLKFKEEPTDELIKSLQSYNMDPKKRNKGVLLVLRNIQKCILFPSSIYDFKFHDFIEDCSHVAICDLDFVKRYINSTTNLIKEHSNSDHNYLINYGSLFSIGSLIGKIIAPNYDLPIKKEHTFLSIHDQELKNNPSICNFILQYDLLQVLSKNNLFSEYSSILLENQSLTDMLSKVFSISVHESKESFIELFKEIEKNHSLINYAMMLFPFSKFKESSLSMICYWLQLAQILIENGIRFSYVINGEKLEFNTSSNSKFSLDFIMNEKESFSLSKDSTIYYNKNKKHMKVAETNKEVDLLYYLIVYELAKKPNYNYSSKNMKEVMVKANNIIEKKLIENSFLNSILSLQKLFIKSKCPLINLIWNLIYTLHEIEITQLIEIINPAESELLLSTFNIFKSFSHDNLDDIDDANNEYNINIDDLIKWCKWAQQFDQNTEFLEKIMVDFDIDFETGTNDIILKIQNEINYLENVPEKLSEFWPSNKFIKAYQSTLIQLKAIQEKRDFQTKESIIKREIQALQKKLIDTQVVNSFNKMKADLIDQLNLITEYSDENLNSARYVVEKFLSDSISQKKNDINFINWPQINIQDSNHETISENIKLFEALIWYAQIKSILDELEKGENIMSNLCILNDFPEMAFPREVFIKSLVLNSNANQIDFTNKDIKAAFHTLNAHMIIKLHEINISFIKDPERIPKIFNDYMNRSAKDEREIRWIYKAATTLPPNLILSIPKFEPNDIIFLVVNKKLKSEIRTGPLFTDVQNQILLKDIKALSNKTFESYSDAAKSIGEIVYKAVINKDGAPNTYDDLKKAFSNENQFQGNAIIIANGIHKLFQIADDFSEWNLDDQKLHFDDISFLSEWSENNWINDEQLLNNFPSLVFWICKNNSCADQIVKKYKDFSPKPNEIPFWLFSLRIMSSMSCISFDIESNSPVALIISNAISIKVRDFLEKPKDENNESQESNKKPLNYDWINLLISDIPPRLVNPYIKMVHDFLINLANDDKSYQSDEINNMKMSLVYESVCELIDSILFKSKTQELITNSIFDQNSLTGLLSFPSAFIHEKIRTKIFEVYEQILSNKSTIRLREIIKNSEILQLIDEIQQLINEEEREMAELTKLKIQETRQKMISQKFKETKSYIDEYNEIVLLLLHNNSDHSIIDKKEYNLYNLKRKLDNYREFFSSENLRLQKINYSTCKEEKLMIKGSFKEFNLRLPNTSGMTKYHFLYPDETIQNVNTDPEFSFTSEYRYYPYIKNEYSSYNAKEYDENKLLEIIEKHTQYTPEIPSLFFGDGKQTSEEFISSLKNLQDEINCLEKTFFVVFESKNLLPQDEFNFLKKANTSINNIMKRLSATFSNGYASSKTNSFLQGSMKDSLCETHYLINSIIVLVQSLLVPKLKIFNQSFKLFTFFGDQYNIKIPVFDLKPKLTPNFSYISNINSLSSPIISISQEKQIICTVNELKCQIGPIFSTQISKPYIINIISFINEEVKYQIAEISDPQFINLLSTKDKLKSFEPIQIFVMPPTIFNNELKPIVLEGKISIETKSIKPYYLPFKFTLRVIPLKIRLQCIEFDLAEEKLKDRKCLRLCCDQIESGSLINFEIINYYIHDYFLASVELESLEENEVSQPEHSINQDGKRISLRFPTVSCPKRCKFLLKIALSNSFMFLIYCDVKIFPFVFTLEYYDYSSKKFVNSDCPIIFNQGISQKIYLRVQTLFPTKKSGKFWFYVSQSIKIIGNDKLNDKIEFTDDLIVSFTLKNSSNAKYQSKSKVVFDLGNGSKTIDFVFINPPSFPIKNYLGQYSNRNNPIIQDYPCYYYQESFDHWGKMVNNDDLTRLSNQHLPYVIVSPYHYIQSKDIHKIEYINKHYNTINVSPNDVSFIQITISDDAKQIINENYSFYRRKKYDNSTTFQVNQVYYSIFGYVNSHQNYWFPAFNKFPNTANMEILPYIEEEDNVNKANSNIQSMMYDVFPSQDLKTLSNCFTSDIKPPVIETNFAIFMELLLDKNIISNIHPIMNRFPNEVQEQFHGILNDIENIMIEKDQSLTKDILTIISHNLIIKFSQIFSSKYNEIESRGFWLELPLSINEINAQQILSKNEYFNFDINKAHEKSIHIQVRSDEIKNALKKIEISPVPNQHERYFIIEKQENSVDLLVTPSKSGELGEYVFENSEDEKLTKSNNVNGIDEDLPPIKPVDSLSIMPLNEFYMTCSRGASILPVFVQYNINKKDKLKKAEDHFAVLSNIYNEVSKSGYIDKSIISSSVNYFKEAFNNCIRRFQRAGISFINYPLPKNQYKSKLNYLQDFIIPPIIDCPIIRHIPWKTKYQSSENYSRSFNSRYRKSKLQLKDNALPFSKDPFNFFNRKQDVPKENRNQISTEISSEAKKIIIDQVVSSNKINNANNINKDLDSSTNTKEKKKPKLKIDQNSKKTVLMNSGSVNSIFSNFSEKDNLKLVIRRIKEKNEMIKNDKKIQLRFSNFGECVIQNQNDLFRPNMANIDELPISDLVDNSQYLIANLISRVSDVDCPFLYMYCNLLFDISSFISIENKLYNFMLLISFSYALAAVEIPFSIAVVADQKFRFVLKPFEEELTNEILQRVFDCIFIKRFKTSTADNIHYALEFMKHLNENRTQRSIFLFSNGIDENFVLAESWKDSILNDINNSFGFIFTKSNTISIEDNSIIEEMWNNFNKVVDKAPSFTKLTYINPDLNDKTIDSITLTFQKVLYRSTKQSTINIFSNKTDILPKFPEKCNELTKEGFEAIKIDADFVFDEDTSSFYKQTNKSFNSIATKFPRLDDGYYRNKTSSIVKSHPNELIKDQFSQFIHKIINSKRYSFRSFLDTIFKPNKASQTVLSSIGTDFDITALVLNLINPVPDPLIYLEEKGGQIRNYGISIIIDASRSCFNQLSSSHSYQTILILFAALSSIDIPCIDVIIATDSDPIVLCTEIQSFKLLSENSQFWTSLLSVLFEANYDKCDLESAIHAVYDIRRMRSIDSSCYMFVLTDGLYQKDQKQLIKNHLFACFQNGFSIFGIGIGIYPKGIEDMFPQTLFATNPNDLIKGIASFFSDLTIDSSNNSIKHLSPDNVQFDTIKSIFQKLYRNKDNSIFIDLKKYLSDTIHSLDAFSQIYNEEVEERDSNHELVNPEGLNTELYVKDLLKGQKILIVMLYKDTYIDPSYITKPPHAGETCVKEAFDHFGIETILVFNYKTAINELTKQTIAGKCDYYAVWVISGSSPTQNLPDGGEPGFVGQFIDCIIQFWNNGGSIVMFADNTPYTFQANLFLERIVFPDGTRTNLRVHGSHEGRKHLFGDPSGNLESPQTFNKSPLIFDKFHRSSIAHNLVDIYEGVTLSYGPNEQELYEPFTPFMRDSDGGISTYFYSGDRHANKITGDIVLDCGFTKLFDQMTTAGTYRYIQNIAGWTAQCESRLVNGINPKDFRPKAVIFALNENEKFEISNYNSNDY